MALLTSLHPTAIQERVTGIDRLTAENQRLQDELSRQQRQMQHLQAAFEEVVAAKQRLESQLAEAQAAMAQLLTENEQLTTDLNELKDRRPSNQAVAPPQPEPARPQLAGAVTLVRDDGDRNGLIRPNGLKSVTVVPIVAPPLRVKFRCAAGSSKILNQSAPRL